MGPYHISSVKSRLQGTNPRVFAFWGFILLRYRYAHIYLPFIELLLYFYELYVFLVFVLVYDLPGIVLTVLYLYFRTIQYVQHVFI